MTLPDWPKPGRRNTKQTVWAFSERKEEWETPVIPPALDRTGAFAVVATCVVIRRDREESWVMYKPQNDTFMPPYYARRRVRKLDPLERLAHL